MNSPIRLAIFDLAGTTIADDGLVIAAFLDAISDIESDEKVVQNYVQTIKDTMGERKIDVFRRLFKDESIAQKAHERFVQSYLKRVQRGEIIPIEGVEALFANLKSRKIQIALNTGFNREILDAIISSLEWQVSVDFSIASSEVEMGRPAPDMINNLVAQFNSEISEVITPANAIVFGDTVADILAAKAAGVSKVIAIYSGAHSRDELWKAGADDVIDEISGGAQHIV